MFHDALRDHINTFDLCSSLTRFIYSTFLEATESNSDCILTIIMWTNWHLYFFFLGRVRKHGRRKWKFIQMAAEVDSSLPVDRCGTGVCDLRSGRSKICGPAGDMASVFTSTHRKAEGGMCYKAINQQSAIQSDCGKSTSK